MVKLLETEPGRSDVLYRGWNHSDPHFNLVFGELLNCFGEFMRGGYAVMFDLPEAWYKELERRHIRLVQLPASGDGTGQLAAWLNSLTPGNAAYPSHRVRAIRPFATFVFQNRPLRPVPGRSREPTGWSTWANTE